MGTGERKGEEEGRKQEGKKERERRGAREFFTGWLSLGDYSVMLRWDRLHLSVLSNSSHISSGFSRAQDINIPLVTWTSGSASP